MAYDIFVELLKLLAGTVDVLKPYATVIGIIVLLLRQNNIKKVINRRLPKQLRDNRDSDVRHIKEDVKRIMNHLGVPGWDVDGSYSLEKKEQLLWSFLRKVVFPARSATLFIPLQVINKFISRRRSKMKAYLKKLGRTKFQAFLLVTIVNLIMLTGSVSGHIILEGDLGVWMPAINLVVQSIATTVYTMVEGSIDREAQKQQVYVIPNDPAAIQNGGNPDAQHTGDTGSAV